MDVSRFLTILGFIVIGIVTRLLPHPPNFTSINMIALFSALYLGNLWLSLATILSILFFSDIILGFHSTMSFVYLSFGLTLLIGNKIKNLLLAGVAASLLFFFVSNFGAWLMDSLYPKTLTGLGLCYLAAIPFFVNQVVGDLVYCFLLFGFIYSLEAIFRQKNLSVLAKADCAAKKIHSGMGIDI